MTDKSKILASYDLHDSNEISTERLLQMVADDCNCSVTHVVDVLYEEYGKEKQNEKDNIN